MLQDQTYDVNSTKSFMVAMEKMANGLSVLNIEYPDIEEIKKSITHNDEEVKEKARNLNVLVHQIATIDTDITFDEEMSSTSSTAENSTFSGSKILEKVEAGFDKIEKTRGTHTKKELMDTVVQLLESNVTDEEIQSSLFDLLGFESFDLISVIITNKTELVQAVEAANSAPQNGYHILSPAEREALIRTNLENAKNADILPAEFAVSKSTYPHVYAQAQNLGNIISISGKKFKLPPGTTRQSYGRYEEVVIPIKEEKPSYVSVHDVIEISGLDILCINTFKGYKTLNKVQSLVYPVAYNTNENMLICAPTGAGKTDIALLAILHTISQFMTETVLPQGDIKLDIEYGDFKVVYIAPLKALAAEIVEKFTSKLKWLNIQVRELTGDMQLTKTEMLNTQVIVTTPEKWDVVTRKSTGDDELASKVKLLIIDEVHLLHEERGSVIETLVARTLRQVESSQSMIRVVGLSATLPNYIDVADFLGVNRQVGMYYFDSNFRPLPLRQEIVGIRGNPAGLEARERLNEVSYDKLVQQVQDGNQVMVFVHSRKDTVNTAKKYIELAQENAESSVFDCVDHDDYERFLMQVMQRDRNKDLKDLFKYGFGIHNAGMLRTDRNLVEKAFSAGVLKVLVCTATLAWGVNLPASTVIIKGTQVYDPKKGGFTDLGISDVIQIFGRAGRPQFEKFGTSILYTSSAKLNHYLDLLTQAHPIESKLASKIVDNLNAEISLGTVMNVDEGVRWLGYTYLLVRMKQNPFAYGIDWKVLQEDPQLIGKRRDMIVDAARKLHKLQMIVFDERSGAFISKDLGRIASDFYLLSDTVEVFNNLMKPSASEADILSLISVSSEFDNIAFRAEEEDELKSLEGLTACEVGGDISTPQSKTNILLQSYISKAQVRTSALISDMNYVAQNSARICRALLSIGINRRWGLFSRVMLDLCKSVDKQIWHYNHPLAQFSMPAQILRIIETKNPSIDFLKKMDVGELGDLIHNKGYAKSLIRLINKFPSLLIDAQVFPLTDQVTKISVEINADFSWDKKSHGTVQFFWIFVENMQDSSLLHYEKLILNQRNYKFPHNLDFMIPLSDPLPTQIIVSAVSDSWIGSESSHTISFQHLVRPENETMTSKLLRLQPLPITALHNPEIEKIYSPRFNYFNAMQTMTFHSLYNTDSSAFLGSPTGSGKTVAAELAIWSALRDHPGSKIVYIAPMKALVRERVDDWRAKISGNTQYKVVELTGDSTPEANEVRNASIIVTTPEKFDGISRNWQTRKFVQQVSLVIMDEIHLLASDRGPILEMIVSRMNYMTSKTNKPVRLLGMSTAVSNVMDMASWLGVKEALFNFPPAVRPVPLEMYIDGFPDNLAFCPLMKKMNKPAFMAIKQHSPDKSVLVFVASRRQTRITALDLIHLCGLEDNPKRFLKIDEYEMEEIVKQAKDETLKLSLQFGIGLHHAGLVNSDRNLAYKLFEQNKIQILVATSTLAWGVNLPAHLVIIKGTQFFDSKIEGYRDMDLTDVLQMMGRAGRPTLDTTGIAMVYTKESKKTFYKHFLNVGFPVESSLHKVLDDHIGAEIASGSITSQQEAMDFLSWTFLFRRIFSNPTYYGIEDLSEEGISSHLSGLINKSIQSLKESKCIRMHNKGNKVVIGPTCFLKISSYYYISHKTVRMVLKELKRTPTFVSCLKMLSLAVEYNELPTRHGEELINAELSQQMRYHIEDNFDGLPIWDPHVKAFLLLEAYFSRIELPIADYAQDTVTVLDQALRLLQAYIDIASEKGYYPAVMMFIKLIYSVKQGHWDDDDPFYNLPGFKMRKKSEESVSIDEIGKMDKRKLRSLPVLKANRAIDKFIRAASNLPTGTLTVSQKEISKLELIVERDNLSNNFKSYCSKYPKPQFEGWFFILSDLDKKELLLMQRAKPRASGKNRKGVISGSFTIPEEWRGQQVMITCVNDAMDIKYEEAVTLK